MMLALCLSALWTTALQQSLDARATWTMERRIAGATRTLVSTGDVSCVAGSGIVWRVTAPFVSSVAMTREAMVFADEEGVRRKELADLPHYAVLRNRTDAFAGGDAAAFDGLFRVEAESIGKTGWRLRLTPEVGDLRRLFDQVELTGAERLTNAVLRLGDGGSLVIRFRGLPRER